MSVWTLYWLTRISSIKYFLSADSIVMILLFMAAIGLSILMAVVFMSSALDGNEEAGAVFKKIRLPYIVLLTAILLSSIINVFIPTDKEIAIIIAGHWATNSEEVAKLPENVTSTLNAFLERAQGELAGGSKDGQE